MMMFSLKLLPVRIPDQFVDEPFLTDLPVVQDDALGLVDVTGLAQPEPLRDPLEGIAPSLPFPVRHSRI